MNESFVIGMVSACTALVASIVGPIVALNVAKRQFNATAISTNRSKRIDTLRDELAELISLLAAALVVKSKWKDHWEKGRGPMNSEPGLLEKFERIVLAQSKVQMLINPDDEHDQRLGETMMSRFVACGPRMHWTPTRNPTSKPSSCWRRRS